MSLFSDLWQAASKDARVVEGVVVDTVRVSNAKLSPYAPSGVVSTLDQARAKLANVGGNVIDYIAGNAPGSYAKGISDYVSPAAAVALSPDNLKGDISRFESNLKKLDSWRLTLRSLSTMASRAGAGNLVQAIDAWTTSDTAGGYRQGYNAISRPLAVAKRLLSQIQSGQYQDPLDVSKYRALYPGAGGGFDNANSYAKRIYEAVLVASQKAATADIPTPVDYALAPITGTATAAKNAVTGVATLTKKAATGAKKAASGAIDWVEGAGKTVAGVAREAATGYVGMIKYVAVGAVALAAVYALSFVPRPPRHSNPRRSRRRR